MYGIREGVSDRIVHGHPVTSHGKVNHDVEVTAPSCQVTQKSVKVSKEIAAKLKEVKLKAVANSIKSSRQSFTARQNERAFQIRMYGCKEIKSLLRGKAPKRVFSWGLSQVDTDPDLFGISFPNSTGHSCLTVQKL